MRCTCALKKDHLDPVPEMPMNPLTRARSNTDTRKPRLSATYSDPSLTIFANGHHKPVHRHNHASLDCAPYKIPRPHSIHGQTGFGQKSLDGIPFRPTDMPFPHSSDSFASIKHEERLVRSAQGSPGLPPTSRFEHINQLPQLDIPFPVYNTSITSSPVADDYSNPQYGLFDQYASPNEEPAPSSAPLTMSTVDWHASDLPLNSYSSAYSQPPSYASFDQQGLSRPGLTTSSSGEVSEADDYVTKSVSSPGIMDGSPYPTNLGEQGSLGSYNLSNDSFGSMTPPPPLLSASINGGGMDPFLQRPMASPVALSEFGGGSEVEADLFTRHGITVQEAQKLAHAGSRSEAITVDAVHSVPRPTSDPLWASAFSEEDVSYSPAANGYQDSNWVG